MKQTISLANVCRSSIEVIATISKRLSILSVVGLLLMVLRSRQRRSGIDKSVLGVERRQSYKQSSSDDIVDNMTNQLQQITKQLGTAHKKKSEGEKELKESRSKFFVAIDEEIVSTETLAQQTISVPEGVDVTTYVKVFHPGWRPFESDCTLDGGIDVLIEEDPSFKKFVYVNHEDGQVYRRNVSEGGPSLDDDRLKAENPKLWKRITQEKEIPAQTVRVLKDLETLPDKDLAAIQEYFVPGLMTVKLDAPRKAKPDELDA